MGLFSDKQLNSTSGRMVTSLLGEWIDSWCRFLNGS